jgi:hypothetical protein
MVRCEHRQADDGFDVARGALHGLLFAIPLWSVLGIVAVVVQDGSTSESTSLALMIAAVGAAIVARPFLRALWMRRYPELESALILLLRRTQSPLSLARQTLALSALTGAYLQFYFLEVNLQIASLNSVTVFLPVSSMT